MKYLGGLISIIVFLELGLIGLWMAVGVGRERRSLFWARVLLASLALPALMAILVGVAQLQVLPDGVGAVILPVAFAGGVVTLMFVPVLLYHSLGPSPGPPDSNGGGGPGSGPPRFSPDPPRGGIPLLDADQAPARVRDHTPPRFDRPRRRRPAHGPRRSPVRTVR